VSSFVVRAPASTANLGPGFDCAAAALDLWNEMAVEERNDGAPLVSIEGEGADSLPPDETNLGVRAFSLFAPAARYSFRFVNRIPIERGLGSSASAIAAGLVAGSIVAGEELSLARALEVGLPLEGHADNLAAALSGGVCLVWTNGSGPQSVRVAQDLPLAPVLVVPPGRVSTSESRRSLPDVIPHSDAAVSAAHATLLGAAIASGDGRLMADAFHDRLHEPYRAASAPLLVLLHEAPVDGQVGVTLSGSGPSVIVWTSKGDAETARLALETRFPTSTVHAVSITTRGAH